MAIHTFQATVPTSNGGWSRVEIPTGVDDPLPVAVVQRTTPTGRDLDGEGVQLRVFAEPDNAVISVLATKLPAGRFKTFDIVVTVEDQL